MSDLGFVGLGIMGRPMAANLLKGGHRVHLSSRSGVPRELVAAGGMACASAREVAERSEVVFTIVPDGPDVEKVLFAPGGLAEGLSPGKVFVDMSSISPLATRALAARLSAVGCEYVDAPVSGGVAGARARTLAVMVAANDAAFAHVEPVLAGLSDRRHRVGDRPGLGQALKLANNFLSATALAATSEAVAFGTALGLDMATMVEVLNASSGNNTATSDKFPNHVVTGRFASGFANSLMAKDVGLYLAAVEELGGPATIGEVTADIWSRFAAAEPGVDFTRIYPFLRGED